MNKVLKAVSVVFVLAFIVCNVFAAGEINVKAGFGLGPSSGESIEDSDISGGELLKGFNIGAEYLHPINEKMKVGGGAFYMSTTKSFLPPLLDDDYGWTYLPVYGTFQIYPFSSSFFFKANLGYSIYAGINWGDDEYLSSGSSTKGGLYFGISVGNEKPSGWFWEVSYSRLSATLSYEYSLPIIGTITSESDFICNFVGFSIGKKLKLK